MAQREKVKEDGRLWEITQINIQTTHLDTDYELIWPREQTISATGECAPAL
jgi:hypothetical protein